MWPPKVTAESRFDRASWELGQDIEERAEDARIKGWTTVWEVTEARDDRLDIQSCVRCEREGTCV